jgi:hypothetical protein
MNYINSFINNYFYYKNIKQKWFRGDYFNHPKNNNKFMILTTPDKNNKTYTICEYDKENTIFGMHFIFKVSDFKFIKNNNIKYKTYNIKEYIEHIYNDIENTNSIFKYYLYEEFHKLNRAASKIQIAWKKYNINKKRKAVAIIEKYVLHYLYKPGNPCAIKTYKHFMYLNNN